MNITHISCCDLESCPNFAITYDVWTSGNNDFAVFCGGCDRDITYTAVPVS